MITKKYLPALLLLFSASWAPAHAFTNPETVHIKEDHTSNRYVAGGKIFIDALTGGDIIGAGGEVYINAHTNGDLLLTGGKIHLRHTVGDDVRVAGGEVIIWQSIGGDLVVTAGKVHIHPEAVIEGEVYIAGGEVRWDGIAKGPMRIVGGKVFFNGIAEQAVVVKGGEIHFNGVAHQTAELSAEKLRIGSEARFHGKVRYWQAKGQLDFTKHLQNGATTTFDPDLKFTTRLDERWVRRGIAGFLAYRLLSGALLITLLVSFFHKHFQKNTGALRQNAGNYIGYGALFVIALPIVALLAFISLIGIPVGFILLSGYAAGMAVAGALTAVVATYELKKYLGRNWGKGLIIPIAIVAFLALRLIGMMAFPGKLIVFIFTLLAIGSVIQWLREGWRKPDDTPESSESGQDSDMV
ncbi:MAG TPA: hypothetical protein PKC76_02935 [Saprospiraceae bacterium]|nr:hypothetical protein [Saprospiraceae bacterium]HMP23057.1 hypothetical protein [Saprospiraceae bacterium]